MASTPPPRSSRARTPPSPMHGPAYDNYEPYSPRRSTRSTAHSNPYSSFNSDRSPRSIHHRAVTPPPSTVKKARFARAPTQLSSPPSSPASPLRLGEVRKTPRKTLWSARKTAGAGTLSDSDHASSSLIPHSIDPATMLPTPSKTPKRRQAAFASTARILSFQPVHPNDAMPSPRKIQKHRPNRSMNGFDLYDEERNDASENIQIFTDVNARVPEMDTTVDNPFIGAKQVAPRPQRRPTRHSPATITANERMEEAVANDEGVVYVFRGKKIFRRFKDSDEQSVSSSGSELGDAQSQRLLKRKAGATAQRPLTRSAVKPRLLFPSEQQKLEREQSHDDADEEAVTDIEVSTTSPDQGNKATQGAETPHRKKAKQAMPSPSDRATRSTMKKTSAAHPTPIFEDEAEPTSVETGDSLPTAVSGKRRSPFDSWQRTKAGRKRACETGEELGVGGGTSKRTKAAVVENSA